jgi:hypothetical protein
VIPSVELLAKIFRSFLIEKNSKSNFHENIIDKNVPSAEIPASAQHHNDD